MSNMEHRIITPLSASHPELGRWLWALEDTRARTRHAVEGVTQDELDWSTPAVQNSIGSLLYHIALIEFDYLWVDILGQDYPEGSEEVLPYPDRDDDGRLTVVSGVPLDEHLTRLDTVRKLFITHVSSLTSEQVEWARQLPDWNYEISPAWTLHHLMQHEGEHRGQIMVSRLLIDAEA